MIAYCTIYPKDISKADYTEIECNDLSIRHIEILAIAIANSKYGINGWDYMEIPLSSGRNHTVFNPEHLC